MVAQLSKRFFLPVSIRKWPTWRTLSMGLNSMGLKGHALWALHSLRLQSRTGWVGRPQRLRFVMHSVHASTSFMNMPSSCAWNLQVFAAFVASWALLRIWVFPRHAIYSSLVESVQIVGGAPPAHALLNGLLLGLYAIHLYWFSLILSIVWRKLATGKVPGRSTPQV
jgi:hypothetical protein